MTNTTVQKAIEIFKATFPELIGSGRKFRPMISERNGNVVEISEDGVLYASINVRSGLVKAI